MSFGVRIFMSCTRYRQDYILYYLSVVIWPLYKASLLSDWDFSEWPLKSNHFWSSWISRHSAVLTYAAAVARYRLLSAAAVERRRIFLVKSQELTSNLTTWWFFWCKVRGETCFGHLTYLEDFYVLKVIEIITLTALLLLLFCCFCSVLIWLH